MRKAELDKLLKDCQCRVIGWEDVREYGHRIVIALLAEAFNRSETALLVEPSLAGHAKRPPDIVLIDPEVGIHVVEVKGVTIDQIESVEAGGILRIRYNKPVAYPQNVLKQAASAMFDVKDATSRAFGGDLRLRFEHWVVFPKIPRHRWHERFGQDAFHRREFLFEDDLEPSQISRRFGAADRSSNHAIRLLPLDQLECVWKAFGDTSVIYWRPDERRAESSGDASLGEKFDDFALSTKRLSDEQKKLVEANWDEGPRLVRGVAGSGKTIVLAANCARRLVRELRNQPDDLFGVSKQPKPKILAVCYNRTLAPFLRGKIEAAFHQRTGRAVPDGYLDVFALNKLMHHLSRSDGLWRYQRVDNTSSDVDRSRSYLEQLRTTKRTRPDRIDALSYDAIYVDEGQDLLEEDFILLRELCRTDRNGEPNLYVFYDDAQNLYGRGRPNWASLGINVRGGRSVVMTECHRNTCEIIDVALNVLYGSTGSSETTAPTRQFFDLSHLQEKQLVIEQDKLLRVKFANRKGSLPIFTRAPNARAEIDMLLARLALLIQKERVRPEDILVLTNARRRADSIADAIEDARLREVNVVFRPYRKDEKDTALCTRGNLTVSTVASAKGYDAFVTLMASANEFDTDIRGRASFYVGCSRAIEYLEVFAYGDEGLSSECARVVERLAVHCS